MDIFTRFLEWFPHRFHWISKHPWSGWRTETKYPLSDAALLRKWEDPLEIIGLRFGSTTRYALLDIDKGSPYHPRNGGDIQELLENLKPMGFLRHIVVQSSDSGGIHIYLPLPAPLPSFKLALALKNFLSDRGYTVRSAHLEIFPNTKAYSLGQPTDFNGHRLPLQPKSGSCVINSDLSPCAKGFSLQFFLDLMDWAAQGQVFPLVQKFTEEARVRRHERRELLSADAGKWRQDLEETIARGWTADGQTNEILKTLLKLGTVFHHLTGERLVNWMVATAKSLPGFSRWCDHIKDLPTRCREWVNCNESHQYYTPYASRPERAIAHEEAFPLDANEKLKQETRNRISLCVKAIAGRAIATVREFVAVLRDKALELFGQAPSIASLYKHRDIWEGCRTVGTEATTAIIDDEPKPEINEKSGRSIPPLYEGCVNPKNLQKTGGVRGGVEVYIKGSQVANRVEKAKNRVDSYVQKLREKLGLCESHTSPPQPQHSGLCESHTSPPQLPDWASFLWRDIQQNLSSEDFCHGTNS